MPIKDLLKFIEKMVSKGATEVHFDSIGFYNDDLKNIGTIR